MTSRSAPAPAADGIRGVPGRWLIAGIALCWALPVMAALSLDDWRRQAGEVRRLAENDAPAAHARASELEAALPAEATPADRARVLNLLARAEVYLARTGEAAAHAQAAFEIASRAGDRIGQAEADLNVAVNTVNLGQLGRLGEVTKRALAALEGVDRPDLLGEALLRSSTMYQRANQLEESVSLAVQAMDIARNKGSPLALAYAHQALGIAYDIADRREESREQYEHMREQAAAAGSRLLEALAISGLGSLAGKRGDPAEALRLHRQAIGMYEAIGAPFAVGFGHYAVANDLRQQGDLQGALEALDRADAIYDRNPNPIGRWFVLTGRSELRLRLGAVAAAHADAQASYELARKVDLPVYLSGSARQLAAVAAAEGDHARAYALALEAAEMNARATRERAGERVLELAQRYRNEARQRELAELTHRSEQQAAELERRTLQQGWLWTVLLASALLLAGTVFFLLRLRRSRAALQQQTGILQSILDSLGDGVVVADGRGALLLMNPAGERIMGMGVTKGEAGRWSQRYGLFLPDRTTLYPTHELPLARAIRGESCDEVEVYVRNEALPAGRWVSVTARPLTGMEGAVAVFSDTTARRQAEDEIRSLNANLERRVLDRTAELERNRSALQAIIENVPAVVFVKDLEGRYLRHNARTAAVLGHPGESLVGRRDDELIDTDNAARVAEEDRQVAAEGRGLSAEHELRGPDGDRRTFQTHVFPLLDAQGSSYAVGGISLDITELKRARQAAEAATRAKSEFLANMSHEIRTPMNAILGMSWLALQSGLDPQQRNYVDKVHRAAESLLGIINDILDFSKIEAGRLDMERIPFRLGDVMEQFASLVGMRAEEKGLELLFELPPALPTALIGDPSRLGQVLLNLGNNAVKFTERGEVAVAVSLLARDADVVRLRFEVRDTGIGLDQAQRERLFQPFTQADAATSRRFGGTGLGLAICRHLVGLMDGEIGVESTPGRGSSFHFSARFGLQAEVAAEPRSLPGLRGLRALVVDDHDGARTLLCTLATSFGLEAEAASDGAQALRAVARADALDRPYHLLLLDWKMPGIDGIDCVEQLAGMPSRHPAPTVLMVTAFNRHEAQQRLDQRQVRVAALLAKPVTPSALLDACAGALGQAIPGASRGERRQDLLHSQQAALAGARILLVEDNSINQELARDLLGRAGIDVSVAADGQEALDALEQDRFDAVLMDCQMPVLDGYAATRALRQRPELQDLPVIAMTANAMAGDRDKVLEAGMNDHIAKPIRVDELFATLARWVHPAAAAQAASGALPALPGIDTRAGLAGVMGNEGLYRRLLGMFRDREQAFGERFGLARAAGDAAACTRYAHDLKSVAGTLGMPALQRAAAALEAACQDDAPDRDIETLLETALRLLEPVIAGLGRLEPASA